MDFKETRKQFQAQLLKLIAEREEIDKKIRGLMAAIDGLKIITGDDGPPAPPPDLILVPGASGFTDRVRAVLRSDTNKAWPPTQVRDLLVQSGIENTKQLLIQVHNTLDRLLKQNEVVQEESGYKWITPLYRALYEMAPPPNTGSTVPPDLRAPKKK